jgi:alkylation response protein AidB-like acyl-CoA dehydrogenase
MCLAVTEAFAGSDVAGIRTTAELTEDGQHFLVSGTKKWITNGMFCDYFVTACKTAKGFSVLLIPRSEAVETKLIKTSYSTAAATTYIQFDKAKVPIKNLLGKEGQGFQVIMSNFNHVCYAPPLDFWSFVNTDTVQERWMMCGAVIRWIRLAVEESLKWSHQRIVFGKPLVDQPVIRAKLARMIAYAESTQAWLEQITHQMNNMSYAQQSKLLSGPIALLKSHSTRCAHEVADEAVNLFGGRGLTRGGMGSVVRNFHNGYKFDAILGGTEEILADLGVRQAMKQMPKARL